MDAAVEATSTLDGGMVGAVHRVDLADGRTVVAKTGQTPLDVEGAMLRYLDRESDAMDGEAWPVPRVEYAAEDLLLLEFVPGDGGISPAVERHLAALLARLHDRTGDGCGFHYDTLSGALRQPNPWVDSWVEFFREFRLRYVADRARNRGVLPETLYDRVSALAADLDSLLTEPGQPALLHGDCWTGNLVIDGEEIAAVLDPAIFYGHPEYDLAYAHWTETVGEPFLGRYLESRSLDEGFRERFRIYAVHPLVEHVWHFGDQYHGELDARLRELGY